MKITQIRNATLQVTYGGVRFLIDPMLAEQGGLSRFARHSQFGGPQSNSATAYDDR